MQQVLWLLYIAKLGAKSRLFARIINTNIGMKRKQIFINYYFKITKNQQTDILWILLTWEMEAEAENMK